MYIRNVSFQNVFQKPYELRVTSLNLGTFSPNEWQITKVTIVCIEQVVAPKKARLQDAESSLEEQEAHLNEKRAVLKDIMGKNDT